MKFVHAVEGLSLWVGSAFGWCILILTLSVSYEVFVRYVLNAPTVWAFDMMIQMYGALFLMCGAYALAQDTHVRADVVYRLFPVRVQATLDFVLYFLFFFPRHAGPGLVRLGNRLGQLALQGSELQQPGQHPDLLLQVADSGLGRVC
jgi:TRAP-type mannitol/chloroaromatic compound transport system permease small subunit